VQKADITFLNDRDSIDGEYPKVNSKTGIHEMKKLLSQDDFFLNNGNIKGKLT